MKTGRIGLMLGTAVFAMTCQAQTPVNVNVDLTKSEGAYKPIYSWFGYDESGYGPMKYGKLLTRELHDLSPVPVHIRAHFLFNSGDGTPEVKWSSSNVFSLGADGKPVYDWALTDKMFDAYKEAGVEPMVELGFMPKDLASTVPGITEYQLHYPKPTMGGSVNNPPKDFKLWGELVHKYVEHLAERYGREEVSKWYFEVWNEPDIMYWHGTQDEYFKLYDYSVSNVRAVLPNAKVGGPAATGPASPKAKAFLEAFLKHCQDDKSMADGKAIPLDFISFHPKGRPQLIDGHVRMGIAEELRAAKNGYEIVAKFPKYKKTEIILSEADPEGCAGCSMKVNPANGYRNGPLYPAYTAAAMKGLIDLEQQAGVNLISMLSWSFEFEGKDYFEGFRTLATNGVDKPILNVFRMAGMFSGDRVATTSSAQIPLSEIMEKGVRDQADIDAFATKASREAAVMMWNYHDDDVPGPVAPVQITVTGIPAGVKKVFLEHFRIDDTHSNSYTVWKAMGSPQSPTPEQYAQLQAAGHLELLTSPQWLDVSNGKVVIDTNLPRQATSLLHLKW
jgi:Glycosyl hydrolases family 39.